MTATASFTHGRLAELNVQVVLQDNTSSGVPDTLSRARVGTIVAQTVTNFIPDAVRVTQLVAQAVTTSIPLSARISQLMVQTLISSVPSSSQEDRMRSRVDNTQPQVVYTIGVPDTERQLAWTFDFDGHTFYVLDLAERGAVVFDAITGSWTKWNTAGYEGHFNFKNGFHWRGGKQVVGGGILDGMVAALDEGSFVDEDFRPVAYEINGVVFTTSEQYRRQFNLRLVGSPGRTTEPDAVIQPVLNMEYSDDNGATWSNPRAITLTTDTHQRIEFRSMGAFRQPGRLFKLYDSGGVKFVAYVMTDIEGEDQ